MKQEMEEDYKNAQVQLEKVSVQFPALCWALPLIIYSLLFVILYFPFYFQSIALIKVLFISDRLRYNNPNSLFDMS